MGELYVQYEYWFATFQLVTAMLGMGATLTVRDFGDILRAPRAVSIGVAIQLFLVPVMAYMFLTLLGISGGLAIGLALVAAIPGGTTSNIFTFFARGNSALSICVTAVSTLACLVSTPLILSLLISDSLPPDFSMPTGQIMMEIALSLLLPLSLGMLLLYLHPAPAAQFSKWCIRASLLGIVLIIIGSTSAGRLDLEAFGAANVGFVALFMLMMVVVGAAVPRLMRLEKRDAIAVEFEVIVRNSNLGVMIKASLFPAAAASTAQLGDTVLFTVLLYGGLQLLIAPILIRLYTRGPKPEEG